MGLLGNDGTRTVDIEGSPGNKQYGQILLNLNPGQSIESIINSLNLPPLIPAVVGPTIFTVTPVPNSPATPATPEQPSKSAEENKTPPAGSQTTPGTNTQSSNITPSGATTANVALSANFANPLAQSTPATSVVANPTGGTIGPTNISVPVCSEKDCADKRAKYDEAIANAIKAGKALIQAHADGQDDTAAQANYTAAAKAAIQAFDDAYGNIANMPSGGADASSAGEQPAVSSGAATGTANGSGAKSYAQREADAKAEEKAADRTDSDIAQFFFENFGNPYWFLIYYNSYWDLDPPKQQYDPLPPVYPEHSVIRDLTEEVVAPDSPSEFAPPSGTPTNPSPQTPAPAPQQSSGGGVSFNLLPTFINCDGSSCAVAAKTPQGLLKVTFPSFNSDIGKSAEATKAAVTSMVNSILPQQLNAMQAGSSRNPGSPTEPFSGSLTSEETSRLLALFPRGGATSNCTPPPAQGNNAGQTDPLVVVTNSRGFVSRSCGPTPTSATNGGQPSPRTSLPSSSTNSGSGAGVANAGSPSGETITTTADTRYGSGGTKETTRNDSTGAVTEEEFKDAKGTTKDITYTSTIDGGAVRTDRLLYRDDGTLSNTSTTIKGPDGSSVGEYFYYDVEGINATGGSRKETAANGQVTLYSFDPNTQQWAHPVQTTTQEMEEADKFMKAVADAYQNLPTTANPAPPPPPSVGPSSLPGYQATTTAFPGLNNTLFTTPSGTVTVHLPNDMSAGDTISGTVEQQPTGKTDPERAQNQSALGGYMLTIGQQTIPVTEKSFTQQIPTTLTPTTGTISLSLNGKTVATTQVPVATTQPSLPSMITMPTGGTQGSSLAITEPTNGKFDSSDYVKLGATTLPELAESPRQKIVLITTEAVGESTLEDRENGSVTRCTFRVLGIRLSASQLSLLKGQTTILTTTVVGLKGITKDSPLDLTNFSDTVINMAEGNEQHLTIHPSEVSADGTYSVQRVLTGIRAGGFRISGTVRWDNTFSHTVPTLGGAGTSTTPGSTPRTYVLTPAIARLDTLGRDWSVKRGMWDLAGIRYLKALDDGMSTADKGKVKAYQQTQKLRWDALMRNMDANTNSLSGGSGQNAKAADDARAKLKEADDKASAATRAAIDTMAPDKKKTVEQAEASLQQATSEEQLAKSAYKAARSAPTP